MARLTKSDARRIVREGAANRRPPFARLSLRGAVVVVFFVFLFMAVLFGKLELIVPFLYLAMSAITIAVYALDKRAANQGGQRTSERALHCLEFFCGWPGALLAQGWLRHKSAKASFGVIFWLMAAANVLALLWLLSRRMI